MWPIALVVTATMVAITLRRSRWAAVSLRVSRWVYAIFVLLAILYFPVRGGFALAAPTCQWTFELALAAHSLTNYPHMVLFAIFYLLTYAQLPGVPRAAAWSVAACLTLGLVVELAQGATGYGNCRMRDMIPNTVGTLAGVMVVTVTAKVWRRWLLPATKPMTRTVALLVMAGALYGACGGLGPDRPKNFAVVEPPSISGGGIYRGAQPSADGIATLHRDLQIRTVVSLNRGDATAVRDAARRTGVRLIEIPLDPRKLGTQDEVTRAAVETAYATLSDPNNAPIYIHCDHGRDRTGFVVALYRSRQQEWAWEEISAELARHGHGPLMRRYLPNISRQLEREARDRNPDTERLGSFRNIEGRESHE